MKGDGAAGAPEGCIFCRRSAEPGLLAANDLAIAFPAGFPVSPGHVLIVPRRHEPDFFSLTPSEQARFLGYATLIMLFFGHTLSQWWIGLLLPR